MNLLFVFAFQVLYFVYILLCLDHIWFGKCSWWAVHNPILIDMAFRIPAHHV